ncbi:MAG: XdhC family protein [Thermoanaerobaculia bacterium]
MAAADPLAAELERALARGERVAIATVRSGPWTGNRLLVWPGGEALGDLGAPRLNQRVALHAEALLERGGGSTRKPFDHLGQPVEVEVAVQGD